VLALTISSAKAKHSTVLIDHESKALSVPTGVQVTGVHLFAYGITGPQIEMLLSLSEGDFAPEEWDEAAELAEQSILLGTKQNSEDEYMEVDGVQGRDVRGFLLDVVRDS